LGKSFDKALMGAAGTNLSTHNIAQSLNFSWGDDSALKRTPSSTGNRRTWTASMWIKRHANTFTGGTNHTYGVFWGSDDGAGAYFTQLNFNATGHLQFNSYHYDLGDTFRLTTNRIFRDGSAWFHLVFALDTTQGTAANRMKMYINGVLETSFSVRTDPAQNRDSWVNLADDTQTMVIGNGYLDNANNVNYQTSLGIAELNFIDGTALTPSSFGETNSDTGQWIPKEYSGSYGTNGYYLKLVSGAIGTDSSGEGNNMSLVNVVNSDVVIDSPTNNFATLDPAVALTSGMGLSEGNQKGDFRSGNITNGSQAVSTIAMPAGSGKWYWEMRNTYTGLGFLLGIVPKGELPRITSSGSFGYGYVNLAGVKNINGTESSYGTAWFSSGQTYIISCYYDSDNRKIGFKLNNTDQGYSSEDVTAGSYVAAFSNASGGTASFPTVINFGQNGTFNGAVTAGGNADANDIGDFFYAPPSGYKALCTANLPTPAIPLPSANFNTVLYTGNGSTQSISGVGFQPDWVWIKNRATTDSHKLIDVVRGVTKEFESDVFDAEETNADGLTAFASDGFALGDDLEYNTNNEAYLSWNWKANGSGSANTVGDVDTVVSANTAAGFSIVNWTGTHAADKSFGHGLSKDLDFIIIKATLGGNGGAWVTQSSATVNNYMYLHTDEVEQEATNFQIDITRSNDGTFHLGAVTLNSINEDMIAYCFHSVDGFSKIGRYTGNGSATAGTFVNCGFKPAWLMYKKTSGAAEWRVYDSGRSVFNPVKLGVYPDLDNAEDSGFDFDFLSNGFKSYASHNDVNQNGQTYFYMAFAESPLKTATAR